jgi:hypothetical protein
MIQATVQQVHMSVVVNGGLEGIEAAARAAEEENLDVQCANIRQLEFQQHVCCRVISA